jgi:hypothetical protein
MNMTFEYAMNALVANWASIAMDSCFSMDALVVKSTWRLKAIHFVTAFIGSTDAAIVIKAFFAMVADAPSVAARINAGARKMVHVVPMLADSSFVDSRATPHDTFNVASSVIDIDVVPPCSPDVARGMVARGETDRRMVRLWRCQYRA